jgi:hypothetical protein
MAFERLYEMLMLFFSSQVFKEMKRTRRHWAGNKRKTPEMSHNCSPEKGTYLAT